MVGKSHEVARKTLNLEDVRGAAVALPPQSEQTRIVERVADLDSLAESAERTVGLGTSRIARLRQSVLRWAFEGRLVSLSEEEVTC
jgi:type I restriction enzyme S subunit